MWQTRITALLANDNASEYKPSKPLLHTPSTSLIVVVTAKLQPGVPR